MATTKIDDSIIKKIAFNSMCIIFLNIHFDLKKKILQNYTKKLLKFAK